MNGSPIFLTILSAPGLYDMFCFFHIVLMDIENIFIHFTEILTKGSCPGPGSRIRRRRAFSVDHLYRIIDPAVC